MSSQVICALLASLLVTAAACTPAPAAAPGEEPAEPPPAVPTDTPEQAAAEPTASPTTAPEPVAIELPETPATASLGADPQTTYKVQLGTGQPLAFEESDLPVPPGSVEAHWYRSGGRYVVAYVGLDLSETGPVCPGNSILTDQGFQFVSNAPTENGACEGFPTLTTDPEVGPRVCQGTVVYVSLIPSDREGLLFGTLEALADEGAALIGLTSTAQTSPGIPEIDLDAYCA